MENNNDTDKSSANFNNDSEEDNKSVSTTTASTAVFKTDSSNKLCIVDEDVIGNLKQPKVRLPLRQKAGYSVGHVYNDLCASMWFTYTLLYFTNVLGFSQSNAGVLVLIGQVADALCTPLIGLASDSQNNVWKICLYGRRKIWHLIGSVCVSVSFPFLFIHCLGCEHTDYSWQMLYYSSFIILFQFGWASVQVAHLSLIPDLTKNPNEKTELSANRNIFTVLSNVCVYGIAWGILGETSEDIVGPGDMEEFRNIGLIVTGIGILFSIVFHLSVTEPKITPMKKPLPPAVCEQGDKINGHANGDLEIGKVEPVKVKLAITEKTLNWKKWLKQLEFYKVAILYMCTRLFGNLSQTYITLYLDETGLPKDSVAYIPLLVYLSGFVASLAMKPLNKKVGRLISYICGVACGLGFCIWVLFGSGYAYKTYEIYGVAVLMGISGSVMLITCLGITADLIGNNVQSGAFVFGAMSFADKLSNGLVVVIVQYSYNVGNTYFYRDVLVFACGIPAVIALITIFTLSRSILYATKKQDENPGSQAVAVVLSEKVVSDADPSVNNIGHINEGYVVTEKY